MVAIATISTLVALVCWRLRIGTDRMTPAEPGKLPFRALAWSLFVIVAFTLALGALVIRNGFYYSDAGYFLTQLRTSLVFHRTLFRDFEFAYGLLLFEWPAAFVRLFAIFHLSAVKLVALDAAGHT